MVTVSSPNMLPITLNGTSSDSDGTIVSHQWVQTDGPAVALSGAASSTATAILPADTEAYSFSYTATDDDGAQSTDTVSVYATKILFSDSFADDSNWAYADDTGNGDDWEVTPQNTLRQDAYLVTDQSFGNDAFYTGSTATAYHTGSYAYLDSAYILFDYRFSVDIRPLIDFSGPTFPATRQGNDAGIMFRYIDENNYYRVSMNARYGFTRFEKRTPSGFETLAVNARGYYENQLMTMTAEVKGDTIIVWIDDEPVFALVDDSPILSGKVALYCQDRAEFDNVLITENPLKPMVAISSPLAYSIASTQGAGGILSTEAVTLNDPIGSNVVFTVFNADGGSVTAAAIASGNEHSAAFAGVANGEHDIMAVLKDADGEELSNDIHSTVGIGGDYIVTVGDSITNGVGDEIDSNNDSADGRIVAIQGYQARLADTLTTSIRPQIVFNEGVGGDRATDLNLRIDSIMERHPKANKVLVLIGTNDSGNNGTGVLPADFIATVETITDTIVAYSKQVWLAEILPTVADVDRNTRIRDYNTEIQSFANTSGDDVFLGPDLYNAFDGNPDDLYTDNLHPNDAGYRLIADEWAATPTLP